MHAGQHIYIHELDEVSLLNASYIKLILNFNRHRRPMHDAIIPVTLGDIYHA